VSAGNPAQRTSPTGAGVPRPDNLLLRVASAAVLAPLAVAIAFIGGWPFVAFWGAAAIGVAFEWLRMVAAGDEITTRLVAAVALGCAAVAVALGQFGWALTVVVAAALLIAALSQAARRAWTLAGIVYAGAVLVAPAALRRDGEFGFVAIIVLFAVVWATDICGYFGGRVIGGPKLWARVSPKKTWAGAISGAAGAIVAGCVVAVAAGLPSLVAVAVLAFVLSAVSQAGDLFESAVKRRFGIKDAGQLIPGHGGVMDRLDGFLAAAVAAAIIGVLKGGIAAPARALLVW